MNLFLEQIYFLQSSIRQFSHTILFFPLLLNVWSQLLHREPPAPENSANKSRKIGPQMFVWCKSEQIRRCWRTLRCAVCASWRKQLFMSSSTHIDPAAASGGGAFSLMAFKRKRRLKRFFKRVDHYQKKKKMNLKKQY